MVIIENVKVVTWGGVCTVNIVFVVVDNIDIQLQIAGKNKTSVYCEC
jgi:hypothetical protein